MTLGRGGGNSHGIWRMDLSTYSSLCISTHFVLSSHDTWVCKHGTSPKGALLQLSCHAAVQLWLVVSGVLG